LLVEEGLGGGDVFQPGKGIVAPHVAEPGLIQLAGEPLAAVEADVDAEGEPGLDAGVHEAEDGMDLVVVQVQALALAVADLQLAGLVVLVDLEGHAGIDAAQHADEAFADVVAGGDLPGDVLFAVLGRIEVTDLAAQLLRLAQGGGFEASGYLQAMGREVLVGDAVDPQIVLQAAGVAEVAQRTAEEQAVKAAEDPADNGGELR
jgi:hypothetical protein